MDSIFFSIAVFIHFAVPVALALFMWRIHRLWSTNFFGPYSKEDKFWNWYTYTAAGLVPDIRHNRSVILVQSEGKRERFLLAFFVYSSSSSPSRASTSRPRAVLTL